MTNSSHDRDTLAADYVLGTLDEVERQEVEARLAQDSDLARRVHEWSQRLSPLAEALPPQQPSPWVWKAIERSLDQQHQSRAVVELEAVKQALLRRLTLWRWGSLGAGAVAATLALYIAVTTIWLPPRQDTQFVAMLNEGAAGPSWFITVDLDKQSLTIRPLTDLTPADNDYELWFVAGSGAAPQSLGLLDPAQEISFQVSSEISQAALPDAVLAISLEPLGGSPTGLPTGPVVYHGALLAVSD